MGVSIEVEFEYVEAGRHQLPCLVAAIPSEVLSTRSNSLRALDECVTRQVVKPQVPRARFKDVDHVGADGERVVYAVAIGRQHRGVENDVEQKVAGDGQADDVGTAGDLVRSIPGIDALTAGVLSARVLNEKDERSGLLKYLSGKAQFDEIVVAQRLGEGHCKARFDRLVCDLQGLVIDQGANKARRCRRLQDEAVEPGCLGLARAQEEAELGFLARQDFGSGKSR